MLPAELYHDVFLIFVLLLAIFNLPSYVISNDESVFTDNSMKSVLLLTIIILFIGLRPLSIVFADMAQYKDMLDYYGGTYFRFNYEAENFIYDNLMIYLACNGFPYPLYYLMIATLYFTCYYICLKKIFKHDSYIMFILFLSAFMTFTSSVNGIKAGAATAIFMVAVANFENWKKWLPLLLISYGFHHAMQLPIVAFICNKLYYKTNVYFAFWIFCLLCAAAHITVFQTIFANYTDEKGASYLSGTGQEWGGKSGFRVDFVLYSAMPVIMGYYAIIKEKIADFFYERILSIYMLSNGVWMLCMYMNYNNRLAALSWGMYVVVLFYPIFRCAWPGNRNETFKKIAWAHIGFTMAMHFVYYAFIHLNR